MHTGPVNDATDGKFSEWKKAESDAPCRHCGKKGDVRYVVWESSCGGYEDYKYGCMSCGKTWWVEGPDA